MWGGVWSKPSNVSNCSECSAFFSDSGHGRRRRDWGKGTVEGIGGGGIAQEEAGEADGAGSVCGVRGGGGRGGEWFFH